jgi:hypothetical protein
METAVLPLSRLQSVITCGLVCALEYPIVVSHSSCCVYVLYRDKYSAWFSVVLPAVFATIFVGFIQILQAKASSVP